VGGIANVSTKFARDTLVRKQGNLAIAFEPNLSIADDQDEKVAKSGFPKKNRELTRRNPPIRI
jgi:hypothetical protein